MKKIENKKSMQIKSKRKKRNKNKLKLIALCLFIVASIFGITTAVRHFSDKSKTVNSDSINKEMVLNIGITGIDTFNSVYSKNIHMTQIGKIFSNKLVNVGGDYSIEYGIAKEIRKVSNLEYIIFLNENIKWNDTEEITSDDIKYTIENIKKNASQNIYLDMVKNIKEVNILDKNSLTINLNSPDELFIYNLVFPILKCGEYTINDLNVSAGNVGVYNASLIDSNNLALYRNIKTSDSGVKIKPAITNINVKNSTDLFDIIKLYRNNEVDFFMTEHPDIINLMGRTVYNMKRYRNGNTKVIFGNPNSEMFSQKEVRQMIAYAVNREYIINNMDGIVSEAIDLPFLDSNIKYKYDIEEAKRVLTNSGWRFESNKWIKKINEKDKKLTITMIVNKDDTQKMQIANYIKSDLESIGVVVNMQALTGDAVLSNINNGNYDITLANVNLREKPDIESIYSHIAINDIVKEKINNVYNSDITKYKENITELENTLSGEVAVIGIYSELSTVIYSKNIKGDIKPTYFNTFDGLSTWEK